MKSIVKIDAKGRFVKEHGLSGTKVHKAWVSMMARCHKSSLSEYHRYGGRGIKVCARWIRTPLNFLSDMGHPGKGMTLDRIDNNGDYKPSNCRWATRREQSANTSQVKFLKHGGKTQGVSAWARELGIGISTLHARLQRGWSVQESLTIPLRIKMRR